MRYHHLQDFLNARNGLPTESEAVKNIATYLTIPGVIVGILLGCYFLPERASELTLVLYLLAGAILFAALSLLTVAVLHRFVGFWLIVRLADGLSGTYLGMCLARRTIFALDWVGLMFIPVVGILGVMIGRWFTPSASPTLPPS